MDWIKRLFCKHDWTYIHPINMKLPGSWFCGKCGQSRKESRNVA